MAVIDEIRYEQEIGVRTDWEGVRDFLRSILFGQNMHYSNAGPRGILAIADAVGLSGRELQRIADAHDRIADAQERLAEAAENPPGQP